MTLTDNSTLSGTVTLGTNARIAQSTIAATNTSITYTNAASLYIDNAPTNGTNVTITNPYALYINAGNSYMGGTLTAVKFSTTSGSVGTHLSTIGSYDQVNSYITITGHAFTTGNCVILRQGASGVLPTGLNYNSTYYVNVIDANNFALYSTAALTTKITFTAGTPSGTSYVSNTIQLLDFTDTDSNVSHLEFINYRNTDAGTSWTTTTSRLQQKTDASSQGFIEFNDSTNASGVSLGSNNTTGLQVNSVGNVLVLTNLYINSGTITSVAATTFNLVNSVSTTLNIGGAANVAVNIGANGGTMTLNNPTITMANATTVNINGANPSIVSSNTGTASIFNTNITTMNIGGASTTTNIGAATGTITLKGNTTYSAGTATLAPIKLTAGTNLTTPLLGSLEYDGYNVYITENSSNGTSSSNLSTTTRRTLACVDSTLISQTTGSISAAGTTQSTATPLYTDYNVISSITPTANGVSLPPAITGRNIMITNTSNTYQLYVYPTVIIKMTAGSGSTTTITVNSTVGLSVGMIVYVAGGTGSFTSGTTIIAIF